MPAKRGLAKISGELVPAFRGRLRGGTWWKGGCWKSVARLGFYDDGRWLVRLLVGEVVEVVDGCLTSYRSKVSLGNRSG
jgi:hypothetical protein